MGHNDLGPNATNGMADDEDDETSELTKHDDTIEFINITSLATNAAQLVNRKAYAVFIAEHSIPKHNQNAWKHRIRDMSRKWNNYYVQSYRPCA